MLGGCSLLAALPTGLARAQLTWASHRPARLQHFRLVKYSRLFSILRAGPKGGSTEKGGGVTR